jgi:hypothetical protein
VTEPGEQPQCGVVLLFCCRRQQVLVAALHVGLIWPPLWFATRAAVLLEMSCECTNLPASKSHPAGAVAVFPSIAPLMPVRGGESAEERVSAENQLPRGIRHLRHARRLAAARVLGHAGVVTPHRRGPLASGIRTKSNCPCRSLGPFQHARHRDR